VDWCEERFDMVSIWPPGDLSRIQHFEGAF
jgi:hypothetical protein